MKRLVLSAMLLSIVAVWGWTFVVVDDAIKNYGVVAFLAIRFTIGTAIIAPFAVRWLRRGGLKTGLWIGVVLAVAYLLQTFGLRGSTPTNTGLITGLFIIFVPPINRILFRVRTDPVMWAVIALSLVGLILLTGSYKGAPAWGDVLTLGCAICFGLHIALLDRFAKHHDASVLALGQFTMATILFWAVIPISWAIDPQAEQLVWPTREIWFALLITGVIATAAGFYIQTFVQQRLSAVQTAIIIGMEPLFAAFFGFLLAKDRLGPIQILGAVLMMMAVFTAEIYPLLRANHQNRLASKNSEG